MKDFLCIGQSRRDLEKFCTGSNADRASSVPRKSENFGKFGRKRLSGLCTHNKIAAQTQSKWMSKESRMAFSAFFLQPSFS